MYDACPLCGAEFVSKPPPPDPHLGEPEPPRWLVWFFDLEDWRAYLWNAVILAALAAIVVFLMWLFG
jgi:hypothetical protein